MVNRNIVFTVFRSLNDQFVISLGGVVCKVGWRAGIARTYLHILYPHVHVIIDICI